MPLRVAVLQKHILSGTQISFGIPSDSREISTLHVYMHTRLSSDPASAGLLLFSLFIF